MLNWLIARGAKGVPGLKRLPILKLLAIGEIALLANTHLRRLEPDERRRLVGLMKAGRGRRRNLTQAERDELTALLLKTEPRLFVGMAADKLSPVRLPRRVVRGPKKRKTREKQPVG
jgi:hypothetical protein